MKKFSFNLVLLLLLCMSFLNAQETPPEAGSFIIETIEFHIDGSTLEDALRKQLPELTEGTVLADENDFEKYITRQQQALLNVRQLKETSRIEYELIREQDQISYIDIDVYVEETWNIIVFPIPEYDSNNGFYVTVKYRDKNFFGTLERFALDLGYENKDGDTTYSIVGDFTYPFMWRNYQWYWKTGVDWEYANSEHDLETFTSVGIDIPMGPIDPTLTVKETYNYDSDDIDTYWLTTNLSLAESFNTGFVLPGFGEFSYNPSIFTEFDYKVGEAISESKEGLEPGFSHALSAGEVNWIGNVRQGVNFNLTNDNSYNLVQSSWDRSLSGSLSAYTPLPLKILWWPFHASARASGFYEFDGVEDNAASSIRGIRDTKMGEQVEYGAFLNTDISITAFTIPRFVEGQGSIFFDAGYVRERDIAYDADTHLKYSVGIEAIGFPLFARSYYIRGSIGFDLKEVMDEGQYTGDNYELFIVLGHHY